MLRSSRCKNVCILVSLIAMQGASNWPAFAQNAPGTHQDNGGINGSLSRGDLEKLSGDHKQDIVSAFHRESHRLCLALESSC